MKELTLTKSNFDEVISSNPKVVVDFWASWCGPCRMMGPVIEQLAEDPEALAVVGKVNVDEEEALAKRYGIMSIPTILVFKNGKEAAQHVGYLPFDALKEFVRNA